MLTVTLPYNPLISTLKYNSVSEELVLVFKKKVLNQNRSYKASVEIAYKMVYAKTSAEVLKVFNELIKGKCTVISVK